MDFAFSAEQDELRRTLRDLAADRATSAHVRAVMAGDTGTDADLWALVAGELGLTSLAVPAEHGGAGGSFVDAAVVLEEAGRALLPVPLLSTIAAVTAVPPEDLLVAGAAGGAAATIAVGDPAGALRHVIDGSAARWLVVAASDALAVVEVADDVSVEPRPTLDPTRRQADLRVDPTALRAVGGAAESARAVDVLRVALAVEAVGVVRWCLAATLDHLRTRVQFDRPIGTFQALQHRVADLVVLAESAASTAYYAAWAVTEAADELPVVAPVALATCADTAYRLAAETIQLHGGIGFTWEHDAHLYFKRATSTRLLLGDTHEQRRLVAQRAGLSG